MAMTEEAIDYTLLKDDLFEGQVDEDNYPEPPSPRPIHEGTYLMKLKWIGLDKDKQGQLRNPNAPQIILNMEVVAPTSTQEKYARAVGRFANFLRVGSRKNQFRDGASDLGDVIRAFDKEARWGGSITNAVRLLESFKDEGRPGKIRVRWSAWDTKYWNEHNGATLAGAEKKALAAQCQFRGESKFREDGTIIGLSGDTLDARLEFAAAYPTE